MESVTISEGRSLVTVEGYRKLIKDDLDWLMMQEQSVERDHIALILNYESIDAHDIVMN